MSRFSDRGYFVKENGPVYFTEDMDQTAAWFETVMGWYSNIVEHDSAGKGSYGVVFSVPPEIEVTHLTPFTGLHLFQGKPQQGLVSFLQVQGIDQLYDYVKGNGWTQITPVEMQPWGAKTCEITTVDGCVLRVFE